MMKVSDLRVRINSYIVLVFLVLMSVFGTALVAYYQSLYTRATDRLQKSVMIFSPAQPRAVSGTGAW